MEVLDISEVAARLKVSKSTVGRLIKKNELKSIKIGRRRVVPETDFDAFLQRKRLGIEVWATR